MGFQHTHTHTHRSMTKEINKFFRDIIKSVQTRTTKMREQETEIKLHTHEACNGSNKTVVRNRP